MGANSQKLKTTEINALLSRGQSFFDSKPNPDANYPKDLSRQALEQYAQACDILVPKDPENLLRNLQLVTFDAKKKKTSFTNAGVILLTKNPSFFIPESHITVVKYAGVDKFKIGDRKDFKGPLLDQIESSLAFAKQYLALLIK